MSAANRTTSRRSEAATARRLAGMIRHGAQGERLARTLAREGVKTRADLKKPAVFSRLSRESQAYVQYNPSRHLSLADAQAIVSELKRRLMFSSSEVIPVGSIRRLAPRVKDLDVLIVTSDEGPLTGLLASTALRTARPGDTLEIVDTFLSGTRRRSLILRDATRRRRRHYLVDLFAFTRTEKPFALFHYTGSKAYNIRIRAFAKRKGWKLNQYGVFDAASGRRVRGSSAIQTEKQLADFLGVTFRSPAERQR